MSDSGRWDFGDRAEAKLKPDSEKSTWEHVSDKFKGTADNAAASAQPESEKSYTQQLGDKFSGSSDSNTTDNRTFTQKTKDAFGMGDNNDY